MPDAAAAGAGGDLRWRHQEQYRAHRRLIAEPDFINGDYDIRWLERIVAGEP
jgi:hypothetical protein